LWYCVELFKLFVLITNNLINYFNPINLFIDNFAD